MLTIDPTASSSLESRQSAEAAAKGASRNDFLKLFVAQLENQNPLDPQDGADFVAQLAQFSQVEQAAQTNSLLNGISAGQMSVSNATLASFVGKPVTVSADQLTVTRQNGEQAAPDLAVELEGKAANVTVEIKDASGQVVRRLELGPQDKGTISTAWDGKDKNGQALEPGNYSVTVTATGDDNAEVTGRPVARGTVGAVDFDPQGALLRLGALSFTPASVLSLG